MAIKVKIEKGAHSINIPHGLNKLLVLLLEKAGIESGEFKVRFGERIPGAKQYQGLAGVKIVKYEESTKSVYVKIQSGSNDTRHGCQIFFPQLHRDKAQHYYDKMVVAFGKPGTDDPSDEDAAPDTPTPAESQQDAPAAPAEQQAGSSPDTPSGKGELPQKHFQAAHETLDTTMLTMVLEEIYKKYEASYVSKRALLRLIECLGLGIPQNITVGYLLRLGYLDHDPGRPAEYSRLSECALALIGHGPEKIKEDPRLKALRELHEQCAPLNEQLAREQASIQRVEDEIHSLRQQIEALDTQLGIHAGNAMELREKITPAMAEASQRYLKITSLLEAPLPG